MITNGADSPSRALTPRDYHERSKHALDRYAPGPASLDWDRQPDPYRVYIGSERVLLPTGDRDPHLAAGSALSPSRSPGFADLRRRGGVVASRPLGIDSIGRLLRLGLGISAWKAMGDVRWAVRCNPSSGNLHPVEAYLVVPALDEIPAGLHHYEALHHALERRCLYDDETAGRLADLPPGTLLLGLSLVPWREAWKYGLRAWRYCQLDLGHAIAALDYAAACLGWRLTPVPGWNAAALSQLLGLDRADEFEPDEPEFPQALFLVSPASAPPLSGPWPESTARTALLDRLPSQAWQGRANRLDSRHLYRWPAVDAMGRDSGPIEPEPLTAEIPTIHFEPSGECLPEPTAEGQGQPVRLADPLGGIPDPPAVQVILGRRSARVFDPRLAISAGALYRLLEACLPRPGAPPWDALAQPARLHLLLFVHRVLGMDAGLYLFARDRSRVPGLKVRLRPELDWSRPDGCPDRLPLYRLIPANARGTAQRLACHQRIAADGSFALAMLAELPGDAPQARYDGLLREAGAIGHVLYLESEALGLGSSGIGCFFDEPIHEILGVPGGDLQTFYMFTLGPAIPDPLASDEPAYPPE